MLNDSQVDHIVDRVTRLHGIQLPLKFNFYEINEDIKEIYIKFKVDFVLHKSFKIEPHIELEFDDSSSIVAIKIGNFSKYLPK